MNRQLTAVLLTYATRRSLWLFLALGIFGFGPSMLLSRGSVRDSALIAVFAVGFVSVIMAFIISTQAKWQFCDQRARLMPRFTQPHIVILSVIALIAFGLYPSLLAWTGQWNRLGVSACSISLATLFTWAFHGGPRLLGALGIGFGFLAFFSLMTPQGLDFWVLTDNAARYAPFHVAIIVAGWVAFIAWLHRLATLSEEAPDYGIPIQAQMGSAIRMERTQAARAVDKHLMRSPWQRLPADWWHDRLVGIQATSDRARQRLLRYGFTPTPVWVPAIFMSIGFFVMFYFISRVAIMRSSPSASFSSLNMMIVMPAMMPAGMLMLRRAKMAQELLLPLSRRAYIDGLLAATARSAAVMWCVMHAALLGLVALLMPEVLSVPFVTALTALSLAVQVYAFGVLTWIAQKPSGGWRLVAAFMVAVPALGALSAGVRAIEKKSPPEPLHPAISESLKQDLSPEQRAMVERHIQRHAEQMRKSQETNPTMAWSVAGTLATVGVISIVKSRQKWLNLELA